MAEVPVLLLNFPRELLDDICEYFLPDILPPYLTFRDYDAARESATDLVNLSLTCRSLYKSAARLLTKCKGHPFHNGLLPYIDTILRNPDIASHETTFRLHPSDHNGILEEHHLQTFSAEAPRLGIVLPLYYYASLIQVPEADARHNYIIHRGRANLLYLLFANLPNLSSYDIYITCEPLFPSFGRLSFFLSVKQIRLVGYSDILSSLDIGNFWRNTRYSSGAEVIEFVNMERCSRPIFLQQVHTIRLLSCRLSTDSLFNVVKNCASKLRTFVYRSGYHSIYLQQGPRPGDVHRRISDASPWDIVTVLRLLLTRQSLETLEIDMREHFSVRRWGLHPRPPALESDLVHNFVNDLKGFPNLRNVTLTQQTLWEPWFNACPGFENERSFCDEMRLINMLPPSIESFALYDVTPDFLPCLFELALHVASGLGFQNLKEVTLRPSPNFIRQLKHARCHQDDPHLQFFDEHDRSCRLDQTLLPRWGAIGMMFKSSGVRVDAALEVHPLDTEDPEPLQRQRELQHWCDKCHFDSSVCVHREPGLFDVYAN